MSTITRRNLLQTGLAAAATVSFGPAFWRSAFAASPVRKGLGPYGPLQAADANGIMLPSGFTSRVVARGGQAVPGTGYVFPIFPDGQATYGTPDGGWILVTNSEVPAGLGGVSAIRFDARGEITGAQRILGGTSTNCAGGPTPWGTWLSCEEVDKGLVYECDPTGARDAVAHPAMGVFKHEAACVDPIAQCVYLSEDVGGGGLYRYTPEDYPDLSAGRLEIACRGTGDRVVWKAVPDPSAKSTPTRDQLPDAIDFARGEGIWYDAGVVYLATTSDETIHAYDTRTQTLGVLYRADDVPDTPLRGVDNVHVSRSGDLFVAEDSYDNDPDAMDICIITPQREVARFLKLTGDGHFLAGELASETVGICFDPSGTRMYVGSQRYNGGGIVYEITGPFRQERPPGTLVGGGVPGAVAPAAVAGLATSRPKPGLPIGLDTPRRQRIANLLRRGLPVGLTLDRPATVRLTLKARVVRDGRRRTVTLARSERKVARGHVTLRLRPAKGMRTLLRARRSALSATLEVRIATPGAPVRTVRRTVRLTAR